MLVYSSVGGEIVYRKIRIAMVTNHLGVTGISTVIMNYCKALDHERYDLTVIAGDPIAEENRRVCRQNGITLVPLPSRHKQSVKHYSALWKALKDGHYDIVHVHGSSSMMAIELTIARLAGIKRRIAHSHNSACPNMRIHRILNPYFKGCYTKALACGKLAGDWLFGEDRFEILPNAFHTEQFVFDPEARKRIREELHLDDKLVIGHIGRFNKQKNQPYLLHVFEQLGRQCSNAVLLLVGTGPDFDMTKRLIKGHPYRDRIILYGVTENTSELYAAMDIFVLPSRHEGLPVVLLEAQMSGLPCVASDCITRECDFGDTIWESINADPDRWAERIRSLHMRSDVERQNYYEDHSDRIAIYNINRAIRQLDGIYKELIEE